MMKTRLQNLIDQAPAPARLFKQKQPKLPANQGALLFLKVPPAIDVANFPDTPAEKFWTSSAFLGSSVEKFSRAMFVDFSQGGYLHHDRAMRYHVRLVRNAY